MAAFSRKHLTDYRWFLEYRDKQIGINAMGRWFYPLRRKARGEACRKCDFMMREVFNEPKECALGFSTIENTPLEPCFPCRSNWINYDEQADALSLRITELCEKEDSSDAYFDSDEFKQGMIERGKNTSQVCQIRTAEQNT